MIGNYEIDHEGGYYIIKEHSIAEGSGKEYTKSPKSYATVTGAVNYLLSLGLSEEDISNECNRAYQSYVQKESQALIKEKARLKAKELEKQANLS